MYETELAKTRLSDVARLAGVSAATASRAINYPEKVSATLRQKVAAAITQLDYVPDGAARALATRRSRTIGAVMPTLDFAIFAAGVVSLQNRLHAAGYTLLLANAEYDLAKEAQEVRTLIERGVDGLVLVGALRAPEVYGLLHRRGVPFVNTYIYSPGDDHPCIGVDQYGAAYRVVEYVLELGHRDVAIITSPHQDNDRIKARQDGFLAALHAGGVRPADHHVVEAPDVVADSRTAMRALMAPGAAVTAVICATDTLAIGALAEARALGLRVPEDISITGFDDLDLTMHVEPPLTTVHVPAAELGERAAEYLLNRINHRSVPDRVELSAELVVRGSTAPPGSSYGRPAA